jgi:hypothetical protein
VRNRTHQPWEEGCYLAASEKEQVANLYHIHPFLQTEKVQKQSNFKAGIMIEVHPQAKPSDEIYRVDMSFFSPNGEPFGQVFKLEFKIVD